MIILARVANSRSRSFALELYPEDSIHCDILDYIMTYFEYAYILHDKDKYADDVIDDDSKEVLHKAGDLKKPHWHVIICFKNPRSVNSIMEELKLSHVETCNFYAYSRYLIHKDSPQKYQYSREDIHTNMQLRIDNALERDYNSQEQDTRILLKFIFENQNQSFISFRQLTEYAMEHDCLLDLKRNTFFYKQFCDDFGFRRY